MQGILIIVLACSRAVYMAHISSCGDTVCRPGRECVPVSGVPTCVCRSTCPDHWSPVCGSDGVSYDNHCALHKAACDSSTHITPTHRRFCRGDSEALIARQEFITQLALLNEPSSLRVPLPDACFENDRNRLREFLLSWLLLSAKKESWYIPGMSKGEELWGHFYSADEDRDQGISSTELQDYLSRNKTSTGRHKTENDKLRMLCLAALIEEADVDKNNKMEFPEFRRIMKDSFTPSRKVCSLPGSRYRYADGAEHVVRCNACVCACGKWVCTDNICNDDEEEDDIDKEEDDIDEEAPEDDPDVQSIRWF